MMWYTIRMDSGQSYALGIIMSGHYYYMERGRYPVLRVRRAKYPLVCACEATFGGRINSASTGYTWYLRGDGLKALIHQLELRGMHL